MKQVDCEACGRRNPMNAMFSVAGHSLCEECGNTWLAQHEGELTEGAVSPQIDPTVCRNCEADSGDQELQLLAGLPVCEACTRRLRSRPFPRWVKLSLAGLVAIAILSFATNLRFFRGFVESRLSGRALAAGDMTAAAVWMKAAASHVPEDRTLADLANFLEGMELCRQDRSGEAVPLLRRCGQALPEGLKTVRDKTLLHAESGAAFDSGDYEGFLAKQKKLLKQSPGDAQAIAGVASAYACKYAKSGKESDKQEALKLLESASQRSNGPEFEEYRQRILHRLYTREIIKQEEFHRRFPNGWSKEGGKR